MRTQKFHGRHECEGRTCHWPGCEEAGEFRAPGSRGGGFDGPGDWRWFCLEHVREFNSGYDWFEGMSPDEILRAQSPLAGWARETRAFRADAGVDGMPRWADFDDPLDAIGGMANEVKGRARGRAGEFQRFTPRERAALSLMGLSPEIDRQALRRRYTELVRRYHPDRNGGDRTQEGRLNQVVEAYQVLRRAEALA